MISKSNKFPTRTQFLAFRARAKQTTTPHLRIMSLPHTPSRLAVIVPIKVNKRAVARNSFKRLAYDQVWKMLKDKNLDCVVVFKPIVLLKGKASEDQIKNELSQNTGLF
ncbi:MAG: ribonuclease P protein component [Microgenomates group bacterium]